MSETTAAHTAAAPASKLPPGSIGLFDTTSSTLANVAPALSVFLTIPAIVASMGSMAPWAFVFAAIAILATGNSLIEYTRRMPSAGGFISYLTRSATGSKPATVLGSMTFYLLLFIYPVSISSTVVFTGIRNLRVGKSRVGLDFTRRRDRTFCNVVDIGGDKLLVNVAFKK